MLTRLTLLLPPALLGVLVLLRWFDGTLIYYVADRYLWLVASGAVFLVGLGIAGLFYPHALQHVRATVRPWQVIGLVLPLLLGFGVPPRPLSADTALQRGLGQRLPTYLTPAPFSFAVDSSQRTFADWGRILYSSADPATFAGQTASITGFITVEGTDTYLTRFQVSCCAADGRPIGILLSPNTDVTPSSWWQVTGTMQLRPDGQLQLQATDMSPTPIPPNPYI